MVFCVFIFIFIFIICFKIFLFLFLHVCVVYIHVEVKKKTKLSKRINLICFMWFIFYKEGEIKYKIFFIFLIIIKKNV